MEELGGTFNKPNSRHPVSCSSRKTSFDIFTVERGGRALQHRWLDVVERIDAHYCIQATCNLAGDHRHDAAPAADMAPPSLWGQTGHAKQIRDARYWSQSAAAFQHP